MEKKKILLVEDDQFTRELYEEVLKDAGFDVNSAVDGLDGLAKIKIGGYDLILLDVMMPKMDGLDVLRSLINEPPTVKNGPIVLLTNLTNDPVIDTAYGLNAKGHLVKSDITPGELVEHVKKYTGGSQLTESSPIADSSSS